MIVGFPFDAIPDGRVFSPHHAYIGLLLALLAVGMVWDNAPRKEPLITAAALVGGVFAFATIWPYYPVTGAALALAGVVLALLAPVLLPFWDVYPWVGPRGVVVVGASVVRLVFPRHSSSFVRSRSSADTFEAPRAARGK